MEYNIKLVELIEDRVKGTFINPFEVYNHLWTQWPQINPKTNIAYAHNRTVYVISDKKREWKSVWNNRRGRKARIWRALGELFNNLSWKRKGMVYDLDPASSTPDHDVVHLERFGITSRDGETVIFEAQYYAPKDTLWIGSDSHMY